MQRWECSLFDRNVEVWMVLDKHTLRLDLFLARVRGSRASSVVFSLAEKICSVSFHTAVSLSSLP